jgi:hypothetical protein
LRDPLDRVEILQKAAKTATAEENHEKSQAEKPQQEEQVPAEPRKEKGYCAI